MAISKLKLYGISDIQSTPELIQHHNAFILPSGEFYLAKGYTGCNPSHQLESSALQISRQTIDPDIKGKFNAFVDASIIAGKPPVMVPRFHYLRTIMVHYYGYALFARQEAMNSFFDYSIIPNPIFYGKEATDEQIETLRELFELNNDSFFVHDYLVKSSEEQFERVLTHKNDRCNWNY